LSDHEVREGTFSDGDNGTGTFVSSDCSDEGRYERKRISFESLKRAHFELLTTVRLGRERPVTLPGVKVGVYGRERKQEKALALVL
jgi:hypothetical protein